MKEYNLLQFYFNKDVKLSIPLVAYSCNIRYIKEKILDYPTFFIKELFEDKYDNEYNLVEETIYIESFGNLISVDFKDLDSLF